MTSSDGRIQIFLRDCQKVLEHLHGEYSKLQTGRASAALVEHVEVEAYGQKQPLKNIAGISVPDAKTIAISPWDKSVMQNVEKALQVANLGVNPVNDGVVIRLNLPPMTEERRLQMVKVVNTLAEDARIAVRKHRQEAQDVIKQEKDEDVRATLLEELQKAVDEMNEGIAQVSKKKEDDLMKI
jgi:ribosome recycling factor